MSRILICLLLFLAPVVSAQQGKGIQVRFAAQALPKDMPEVRMVAAEDVEDASDPFEVPTEFLSPSMKAPGRVFGLQPVGADKPLVNVRLPDQGNEFLVLLVLSPEREVKPVVMALGNAAFKAGDVYLYNSTSKPILGKLGTTDTRLMPAKGEVVTPAGIEDGRSFPVVFGVADGNEVRVISQARWPAALNQRCYVFFYADPNEPDRILYRAIDERVMADAEG